MIYDPKRFCRYCKTYDRIENLVYYAHCSYGHPKCLLWARGMEWLKKLHTWQYNKIRWEWIDALGLVDELKAYLRTMGLTPVRKKFSHRLHVRGLPKKLPNA